ncbi:MAG: AIM24 family protein [Actinomycetota bacterium]|nr:AIM24 family protein [Actinomycetota bacterium]
MYCDKCGKEVEGGTFCRFCGNPLDAPAADAQAASAPPEAAPTPQQPQATPAAAAPPPSSDAGSELEATTLKGLVKEAKERESADAFMLQSKKLLKVNMDVCGGHVLTKVGSMIAYQGQMSFSRQGSGGAAKYIKKKISGEQFSLMMVQGTGDLFLADAANNVILLYLDNEALAVEALNLLAFTPSISWDITRIKGAAGMMSGGLWTVELSGTGYLALICKGDPLTLEVTPEQPTYTDPNATVAWSQGLTAQIHMDANLSSLKGIMGSRHGELFQLMYQGTGFVLIQPSEEAPKTSLQDPSGGGSGSAGGILGGILGQ